MSAPPRFPFSEQKEKGHRYISVHEVASIEVSGPERVAVNSPTPSFYWGVVITVTTKNGETLVINTCNTESPPSVDTSNTLPVRKPGWWKKLR
jgi:hypothetical protein